MTSMTSAEITTTAPAYSAHARARYQERIEAQAAEPPPVGALLRTKEDVCYHALPWGVAVVRESTVVTVLAGGVAGQRDLPASLREEIWLAWQRGMLPPEFRPGDRFAVVDEPPPGTPPKVAARGWGIECGPRYKFGTNVGRAAWSRCWVTKRRVAFDPSRSDTWRPSESLSLDSAAPLPGALVDGQNRPLNIELAPYFNGGELDRFAARYGREVRNWDVAPNAPDAYIFIPPLPPQG